MKIALVTHWLSSRGGGISQSVSDLSAALLDAGVEVRVFGLRDQRWKEDAESWSGAPVTAVSCLGPPSLGYAPGLLPALRTFAPDVVHSHGLWLLTSAAVVEAVRGRCRLIVSPHGMLDAWALRRSRFKKGIAMRLFERQHLFRADCLHALAAGEAASLKEFGLGGQVATIPNGVSVPVPLSDVEPPWRDRWYSGEKIVLFLGRIHPKKNLAGLINAFSLLQKDDAAGNWRLAIAGWDEGDYQQQLQGLVHELSLDSSVYFTGALYGKAKAAALGGASAFVLPSFSEGLPIAVLEAWSYGLPVAMSRACNLPEGFEAGAAKEVGVEVGDLATDLMDVMSCDASELRDMGARGQSLVFDKFSWPLVANEFVDLYRWLIEGGETPRCVSWQQRE